MPLGWPASGWLALAVLVLALAVLVLVLGWLALGRLASEVPTLGLVWWDSATWACRIPPG